MNRDLRFIGLLALSLQLASGAFAQTAEAPLANCNQLVVVVTKEWDAVPGKMFLFERSGGDRPWHPRVKGFTVVVGRNGLGWGRGLNPSADLPGPVKHEGDGKSPAGIFRLSSAFGLAEPAKMKSVRLPYAQLTASFECVDDVKSTNYNLIVDRAKTAAPDWNGSEKMRAVGEQYRLGVVVDHNADPRENGGGSCIFLHIWKSAKTGTSGCTAMTRGKIESLLAWLDPSAHPALVQLPETEYKQLQTAWSLPQL
jgi:L,D-peptidoglycan transpeptidase YkuD (ErfK/YbiS/YcfS/YnhG family)